MVPFAAMRVRAWLALGVVMACAPRQTFEQAVGLDVSIDSLPTGAVVTENEKTVGTTPAHLDIRDQADHVLVVQKDGFHPAELKVSGKDVEKAGGGAVAVALAPQTFQSTSLSLDDAGQLSRAAQELVKNGDADDAIQYYRRVIALKPAYGPPYKGLGICYTKLGKRNEALDAYRQYLLYAPDAPDAKQVEAIVSKATGGIVIPPPKEEGGF